MSSKGAGGSGGGAGPSGTGSAGPSGTGGGGPKLMELEGLRRMPIVAVRRALITGSNQLTMATLDNQRRAVPLTRQHRYMMVFGVHGPQFCRVSGLFYAGRHRVVGEQENPMDEVRNIAKYWDNTARRQWGAHVFVYRAGMVCTVTANLLTPIGQWSPTSQAPISQMYPVVRMEFEMTGNEGKDRAVTVNQNHQEKYDNRTDRYYLATYWLNIGLLYSGFIPGQYTVNPAPGSAVGYRSFVRVGEVQDKNRWGGVQELTDDNEPTIVDKMAALNSGEILRFALYVCAGAKLVVVDPYLKTVTSDGSQHNRTLIQQGGLVVVEGQLQLMGPEFGTGTRMFRLQDVKDKTNTTCIQFTNPRPLAMDSTSGAADCTETEIAAKLQEWSANSHFPVLFLGPIESEYGSIAWQLELKQYAPGMVPVPQQPRPPPAASPLLDTTVLKTLDRQCCLIIPEGGRFEAIEDWKAGMQEVRARHLYERLHEPNVEMTPREAHIPAAKRFAVPADPRLLDKILGRGKVRTVYTNIHVMHAEYATEQRPKDRVALPVIYNRYKCVDYTNDNRYRPWVRPDWPLIQYSQWPDKKLYRTEAPGLMSTGFVRKEFASDHMDYADRSDYLYQFDANGGKEYYQVKEDWLLPVFEYKKYGYGQVVPANKPLDGKQAYVGIDGCTYVKQSGAKDRALGHYQSLYYGFCDKPYDLKVGGKRKGANQTDPSGKKLKSASAAEEGECSSSDSDTGAGKSGAPPVTTTNARKSSALLVTTTGAGKSSAPSVTTTAAGKSSAPSVTTTAAGKSSAPSVTTPAAGKSSAPSVTTPAAGKSSAPSVTTTGAGKSGAPPVPTTAAGKSEYDSYLMSR